MTNTKCNTCGLCKANCPVYIITKNESKGPRGQLFMIKENLITEVLNECLMCDACKTDCPSEIDIPKEIRKARTVLIDRMQESEEDKVLIKNLRETGNIYGIQS